jgi:hypothetical protein
VVQHSTPSVASSHFSPPIYHFPRRIRLASPVAERAEPRTPSMFTDTARMQLTDFGALTKSWLASKASSDCVRWRRGAPNRAGCKRSFYVWVRVAASDNDGFRLPSAVISHF